MTEAEAIELGQTAMDRNPQEFPYGYFSGGSFVLDSTRVLMWFESPEQLLEHLCECDPLVHGLEAEEAQEFSEKIRAAVSKPFSLTDENLGNVNEIASEFLCVDWWGTFEELLSGGSEMAVETRSSFRDDDDDSPIEPEDVADFAEYLHQYGF